jgi:hypothetical protein
MLVLHFYVLHHALHARTDGSSSSVTQERVGGSVLYNNCNHFSNEVSVFLTGGGIPSFILDLPKQALNTPIGGLIEQLLAPRPGAGGPMMGAPPSALANMAMPAAPVAAAAASRAAPPGTCLACFYMNALVLFSLRCSKFRTSCRSGFACFCVCVHVCCLRESVHSPYIGAHACCFSLGFILHL